MLDEPLGRRLRPHLGHTRNVVARVPHEREIVDDERRRHTELGGNAGFVERGLRHGVDERDVRRHQLRQVLVASGDDRAPLRLGGRCRQGADHVVRLHLGHGQQRHAHRSHDVEDGLDLHPQVVRHARAVGLVVGVESVAEGRPGGVEHRRDGAALVVRMQLAQHADHATDGAGGEAVYRAQIRQRVEGSEQVGRAVYQHQRFVGSHRRCLLTSCSRPGAKAGTAQRALVGWRRPR